MFYLTGRQNAKYTATLRMLLLRQRLRCDTGTTLCSVEVADTASVQAYARRDVWSQMSPGSQGFVIRNAAILYKTTLAYSPYQVIPFVRLG
jgi:hypothetical protein